MIFIGIDPGVHGGIAFLDSNKQHSLDVRAMPIIGDKEYDLSKIKTTLREANSTNSFTVLERQHCMPGEGLPRTFKTGFGFGILLGMLAGLEFPHQVVTAVTWQKRLFKGLPARQDTKVSSAVIAQRLFPATRFYATERSRVIADGMTDAACIAMYAQRFYGQNAEIEQTCIHKVLAENTSVCITCGEMV